MRSKMQQEALALDKKMQHAKVVRPFLAKLSKESNCNACKIEVAGLRGAPTAELASFYNWGI